MGRALTSLLGFVVGLVIVAAAVQETEAHHNTYLPLVPNTPVIQNMLGDGNLTWCLNANAAAYPNFKTQMEEMLAVNVSGALGIAVWQIEGTFETTAQAAAAGCEVHNVGRYDAFCNGCAGNIHYANWPVTINYYLALGYFEWKTTSGHEYGHLFGLHEQYIDLGSINCDRTRTDTVMSCGTGIWKFQTRDIQLICALVKDAWPKCKTTYPVYDEARGCDFYGYWCYRFSDGVWIDPNNQSEWCCGQYSADGARYYYYNQRTGVWYEERRLIHSYDTATGGPWVCISGC
jgi:hypothetical protein